MGVAEKGGAEGPHQHLLHEVEGDGGDGEEAAGVEGGDADVGEGEGGDQFAHFGQVGHLREAGFVSGEVGRCEVRRKGGGGLLTVQQPNTIRSRHGRALRVWEAAMVAAVRLISSSASSSIYKVHEGLATK